MISLNCGDVARTVAPPSSEPYTSVRVFSMGSKGMASSRYPLRETKMLL
jgi:hypothetical protein